MRLLQLFLLTIATNLCALSLPDWFTPLREAVYGQNLGADEIQGLYQTAKNEAANNLSGAPLNIALSRCEYMMGRAYQDNKRDEEARPHYQEGIKLAEKALEAAQSADAWLVLAQNLSQACSLGPWTYTMANGLNVEKFSKNALALDSRNAAAHYLIAARWVFAPAPFSNHKKGIEMMQAIITECDMDENDRFDVYSAIGYAYIQQKKHSEARPWLLQALEIYPTNKYAGDMLGRK